MHLFFLIALRGYFTVCHFFKQFLATQSISYIAFCTVTQVSSLCDLKFCTGHTFSSHLWHLTRNTPASIALPPQLAGAEVSWSHYVDGSVSSDALDGMTITYQLSHECLSKFLLG